MSEAPDGLAERIASYRSTREYIERETLPLATSVDGVTFEFHETYFPGLGDAGVLGQLQQMRAAIGG